MYVLSPLVTIRERERECVCLWVSVYACLRSRLLATKRDANPCSFVCLFVFWSDSPRPQWAKAYSFMTFLDHTTTPLDE